MYTIGIVGGSGYVGFSLAQYLSSKYSIKIVDIKPPIILPPNCTFFQCDIIDREQVRRYLNDVDLVIHAAIIQIPLITENKQLAYNVNYLGTQNICAVVDETPRIKGMILTGTWHTIGERELKGDIDEEFGFRPDKVENRARLYALSKMGQESIVRFYDEMSEKIYGIIRMGTVLGVGMPEKTAANIFIERALQGKSITPYKSSMYRPMLYVDINDICLSFDAFITKIMNKQINKTGNSLSNIVNIYYPEPITILDLANIVKQKIIDYSHGKINPIIEIVDDASPILFTEEDKYKINVNISKIKYFLNINTLTSPEESIKKIISLKRII